MIDIVIPNNNLNERKYILDIICNEFLGLKYNIEVNEEISNWEINFEEKKIIIEDHFFNKYPKDLEYLNRDNIPVSIEFGKNRFTPEEDIPIVYGNDKIDVSEEKIVCGMDIFASSFFMLTRWEEYINKKRDNHNRFPASESLAYKNNFLDRPIVNEYVEMLWNMLIFLKIDQKRKIRKFTVLLTHDIDHIRAWDSLNKFLYRLSSDIIKYKSLINIYKNIIYYLKIKLNFKKDPYDTYEYIMDLSEEIGVKSYFFFMGGGLTKNDSNYIKQIDLTKKIINNIEKRNHYIGIHPSYITYNNPQQLKKEIIKLEELATNKIKFGRQHYLRFEIPTTWQVWEDNFMEFDSTLCYGDTDGFRCGVCYEYNTFSILTRKKLKLKEKPLIMMDANSIEIVTPAIMKKNVILLIDKVQKYQGEFVMLWHNSSFNIHKWQKYENVYIGLLNYLKKVRK